MYNKTNLLLHSKHSSIRNQINYNFIFNNNIKINNNLKLFRFEKYRNFRPISQSNNARIKSRTQSTADSVMNNNKYTKNQSTHQQKLSSVERTRYSFVRLKNRNQNTINNTFNKTDFKRKDFVNLLQNNNYLLNKWLTKYRNQNTTKYYANHNYVNNYSDFKTKSLRTNERSLKSKVSIIGGIAYRVTRNTLTKKLSPKDISKTKSNYSSTSSSTSLQSKETLNINKNSNKMINKLITDNKSVNNNDINDCKDSKNSSKCKILIVRGIKYLMESNGKTIRQMPSNGSTVRPKDRRMSRLDIGGVTYRCSKPGLFISTNAERVRQLRNRAIKSSINRILLAKRHKTYLKQMPKKHCIFYCRFGRCMKGINCPYIHDKDKIAVCSRFIRGTCKASDCTFSHKVAPEKMPVCSFFLQGRCSSDSCPYRHVKVNSDAIICKDFLRGYCPKGTQCKSAHVFVCIDFNRNGKCSKGSSCPLPHNRIGESVKRKKSKKSLSFRSAKQLKQLLDINNDSQRQPLPPFIPLFTDNNESDNKSSLIVEKTDTNTCDLPPIKRKAKVKYFWTESDDENSHCFDSDTDDNEEKACRPTIRIIPKFLFE